MWAEPKKMDEPEVIRAVLDENGLDGGRLLARAQSPEVKQGWSQHGGFGRARHLRLADLLRRRRDLLGKDRLRDVEEAIAQESTLGTWPIRRRT